LKEAESRSDFALPTMPSTIPQALHTFSSDGVRVGCGKVKILLDRECESLPFVESESRCCGGVIM
jgi:hypothetical protein